MCHASYALSSHWIRFEATVNVDFKWKYITFAEKPTVFFFWTAQKPGWRASRWKRQVVGGWKHGPVFALKETLGGGEGRALSAQLSLERLLPGHIFCLPLSLFSYYLKWPDFPLSFAPAVFFDIHLDWSFIKKAQTIEWLLIKSSSIWPLALYPSVPSLLLGRIHLFLN